MDWVFGILFLGVIFAIVFIRGRITSNATRERTARERADAARYLATAPDPAPPPASARQSYESDDPPPSPPPGW